MAFCNTGGPRNCGSCIRGLGFPLPSHLGGLLRPADILFIHLKDAGLNLTHRVLKNATSSCLGELNNGKYYIPS